jgi:rRNA maturation RNase YbeY
VLRILGLRRHELSLSLVDDEEIRVLNAAYRGHDRATDVLAFALTEDTAPGLPVAVESARHPVILGDVVISIETAAAQARASRRSLDVRLDALLIHGILHLVGYDHERSPAEERRMRAKERTVRAALPTPRPPTAVAVPRTGRALVAVPARRTRVIGAAAPGRIRRALVLAAARRSRHRPRVAAGRRVSRGRRR